MYKNIVLTIGLIVILPIVCGCENSEIKRGTSTVSPPITRTTYSPTRISFENFGEILVDQEQCIVEEGCQLKIVSSRVREIYDAPGGNKKNKTTELLDLYYVYGIVEKQDGTWFNIGYSPIKNVSEAGWILHDDDAFYKWIHRCVFRPERIKSITGELSIYESFDDLMKAINGSTDVLPIGSMKLPNSANTSKTSPYPIIEQKTSKQVTAYNVAMIGKDDKTSKKNVSGYSDSEVKAMQKEILTLDLVVCLDTTGSMQKWMDTTKETIKGFVSTFQKENIDVRVALITYKDHDDGDEMLRVYPFESITSFSRRVGALKEGGGGDDPEAGMHAVMAALKQPSFRNRSQRALVIVGDAPYHLEKGPSNPDGVTNENLIRAAHEKNVQIFLMAVGNNKELANQLKDVVKRTDGEQYVLGDSLELAKKIRSSLEDQSTKITATSNVFQQISQGKSDEEIARLLDKDEAEVAGYVRILREAKGIDIERLRQGEPVVLSGWIAPFHGNQIAGSIEVMLFREECEEILSILQEIIRVQPAPHVPGIIWNAARNKRLQNVQLGTYLKNGFLPHRDGSVLDYSLEDISRLSEFERKRLQDGVYPLIGKVSECLNDNQRWTKLKDSRTRGFIPEDCLP